jgi:hypothetical protein
MVFFDSGDDSYFEEGITSEEKIGVGINPEEIEVMPVSN